MRLVLDLFKPASSGGASRLLAMLLLTSLSTSSLAFAQPGSSAVPPNVLMIVYDDLDISGDLEPYGATTLLTPFSQKLADQGKKFERFYTNAAICSPTRIGLQTGLYPTELGFNFATGDLSWRGIPSEVPTLGRLFSDLGFRTGAFGKWHAGKNEPDHYPAGAGFDTSAIDCTYLNILPGDIETMDEILEGFDFGDNYDDALFCDAPRSFLMDSGNTYATTYTVDKALEFIADALDSPAGSAPGTNSDPFFAQVWLHAPHTPLTCPPELNDTCPDCNPDIPQNKGGCPPADARFYYEAVVEQAETQLMRLHDDLVARGVWNDTIVILTSDNGGVKNTQLPGSNLKGSKGTAQERGIRTPFLVRGPGITQGTVTEPVIGHDLLVTFADHFNQSLPNYDGPGESFRSLVWPAGAPWEGSDRPLFWELSKKDKTKHVNFFPYLQYAVRKEVRGKPWKLVQGRMANGVIPELFDFSVDEGESNNLAFQETAIRNHLLDELSNWRVSHNAFEPEVANLVGAVTQNGDAFTFSQPAPGSEHGMVELVDHPVLTIGDQDFSVSFTFTATALPAPTEDPASLIERTEAWEVFIDSDRRMTFRIRYDSNQGPTWGSVEASQVTIQVGKTYRVTAVSEATRGLSLYIEDTLAKVQLPISPVKKTDSPLVIGRRFGGKAPFLGTISDVVVHPLALRTVDLELDDAYATGFEVGDDQPFNDATNGTLLPVDTESFRGSWSLKHEATQDSSFSLPFAMGSAIVAQKANDIEYQLSVWVKGHSGEESVSLYLLCIDGNGQWNWPGAFSFSHHLATMEWRRITHQHQCPTGTEALSFRLDNNFDAQTVYWDEVSIGYIGKAQLNELFEDYMDGDPVTSVFAADGFLATSDKARSGTISMEVPKELQSSSPHYLPVGGENHFITSFWATTQAGIGRLSVKFCCQNTAPASCIETIKSSVESTDWQRYQLWDSCPAGTTQVGIILSTENSNVPILIDDFAVTTTADPY